MVLPGVVFDVLLGMSWITAAGVSLDVINRTIRHKCKGYKYKQLRIPSLPEEVPSVTLYTN